MAAEEFVFVLENTQTGEHVQTKTMQLKHAAKKNKELESIGALFQWVKQTSILQLQVMELE